MKRVGKTIYLVLLVGVASVSLPLVLAQPAAQFQYTTLAKFCWRDIIKIPEILEIGPIPVGCEVIDCCPGCPGPPLIDWRIQVLGEAVEGVDVRFENMPGERAGQLQLEGQARRDERGGMRLGKGETVIRGLPRVTRDQPPVARLRIALDKTQADRASGEEAKQQEDVQRDAGRIEILIEQLVGKVVVNEYRLRYDLILCPPRLNDRIDLNNNAANDSAVVLLDARRGSGCVDDEVHRGNDIIGLGSVLSNQACRSEVAVFSDDDAMQFLTNVLAWTNSLGDTLPVDQTPDRLMAPVSVWLARANAGPIATGDIANANLLYNSNNVGIGFADTQQDLSTNQNAINTIGTGCGNAAAVQASAFFTANRLNVYYVNSAFTGVNCNANRNINFVGTTANNQSLAHEFGHAMSLGHTNGLAGFPAANVMIGGGANRTHFSEGQGFRLNVHCGSTINANATRAGAVRNCNNTIVGNATCPAADAHCPALALDVQPK